MCFMRYADDDDDDIMCFIFFIDKDLRVHPKFLSFS